MGSTNVAAGSDAGFSAWREHGNTNGKNAAGLVFVALIHGLALWLTLSGLGRVTQSTLPVPPIVAEILPAPEPPLRKPQAPTKQIQPRTPRAIPPSVPIAESTPDITPLTSVVQASPASTDVFQNPEPPGTELDARPRGPRGFGSILNRDACMAAFAASYPREARRSRQEGTVTIAARIGVDGHVLHAEVVESNPRRVFDRAALNVLNSGACRFDPDTAGYDWRAEVSYRLQGESAN